MLKTQKKKSLGCFSRVKILCQKRKKERLKIKVGNGEKNKFLKYVLLI